MPSNAFHQLTEKHGGLIAAGLVALGWFALYAPVYVDFAEGPWRRDENAHAPFIAAICLAVGWARLEKGRFAAAPAREAASGVGVAALGLAMAFLGRAAEAEQISSASQSVLAFGLTLALIGVAGARALWFPLALSLYLIIWPGWLLDEMTLPLKIFVSQAVADLLYAAGAPVAHAGATIAAGPYQLLVADACAGLNSLIALTSVGAVYLYAARRPSRAANLLVLAALAPIAILANVLRVVLLVLITLHLGYDAGQSYLHEGAGLVMFAAALGLVFAVDVVAGWIFLRPRKGARAGGQATLNAAPRPVEGAA